MSAYLEDHPPARSQFRPTRRAKVTGAIVAHTAENTTDQWPPDGGAEGVARFIARRTDGPGSYHTVVDSDSIVRVGRYEWEMFHEGTGGNRWSLGLSFACQANQWATLPGAWVNGAIDNGARAAADMATWVRSTVGIEIPPRRITPAQYRAGAPGFIGHGELDPGRRHDPGARFPWSMFLAQFAHHTNQGVPPMPTTKNPHVLAIQQALIGLGYSLDDDGIWGPITAGHTANALPALIRERSDLKETVAAQLRTLEGERREHAATRERLAELEAAVDLEVTDPSDDRRKAMVLESISPNIVAAAELLAEMAAALEGDR